MSNEYKDWLLDCAQDYVLDNYCLTKIEWTTTWDDGYLMIGHCTPETKACYFVWQDEEANWNCRQIIV